MISILMSFKPRWIHAIIETRLKVIEMRKSAPKKVPFKVFMYETKEGSGKVVGEFICDEYFYIEPHSLYEGYEISNDMLEDACLNDELLWEYGGGKVLRALHISELKVYDTPKDISEFYSVRYKECEFRNEFHICEKDKGKLHSCKYGLCDNKRIKRPPQSWCYVEEL